MLRKILKYIEAALKFLFLVLLIIVIVFMFAFYDLVRQIFITVLNEVIK